MNAGRSIKDAAARLIKGRREPTTRARHGHEAGKELNRLRLVMTDPYEDMVRAAWMSPEIYGHLVLGYHDPSRSVGWGPLRGGPEGPVAPGWADATPDWGKPKLPGDDR